MKRLFVAISLTCVLSVSALAGEVPTVGVPQPPPSATTGLNSSEDMPTDGSADQISGEALSALLALLSFLAV
jgi:hypothetical protein